MKKVYQSTIGSNISVSGVGLHSGRRARVTLRPAQENTGYLFIDMDSEIPVEIPASFDRVTDTTLATTIGIDGVRIKTVEHLIAAFRGMDIDNVIIEVEGGEVPIMDGSAAPFVYLLKRAGVVEQQRLRKHIVVKREVSFYEGDKFIKIFPDTALTIELTIDFSHPAIGRQSFRVACEPDIFEQEIAKARTFGFLKEVEYLKNNGLAMGGSLENAVVLGHEGILNREGTRTPDEFVRHKILDLMGDLALLGYPLTGRIIAYKSGHSLNNKLCREIFENRKDFRVVEFSGSQILPAAVTEAVSAPQ